MKALLTFSTLFCIITSSIAMAQQSPYISINNVTYSVEPVANTGVVQPAPIRTPQPQGYYINPNAAPRIVPVVAPTPSPLPLQVQRQEQAPLQAQPQPAPTQVSVPASAPVKPTIRRSSAGYLDYIRAQGKIRCGTNTKLKPFARLEDGIWYGIDADICKAFAIAILGDADKIEMINVEAGNVFKALANDQIDVMLSGTPMKSISEINEGVEDAGLLYYDQQLLMVDDEDKEPEYYRGKKVCISTSSDYYRNFEEFNLKNDLNATYLTFNNMEKVQEAFLLKRCQMMTASALILSGIKQNMTKTNAKIYSDQIAITPIYALVRSYNEELRLAIKWILNALLLAEQYGINGQNVNFFTSHNNPEIRNLMGDNPELWQNLGLRSLWLSDAVRILGNYGEIYDRNIGTDSEYKIERKQGKLLKDGGTVYPLPFM